MPATTRTLAAHELRIGQIVDLSDASGPLGRFVVSGDLARRSMPVPCPVFTSSMMAQPAVIVESRLYSRDGRELRVELVREPEKN